MISTGSNLWYHPFDGAEPFQITILRFGIAQDTRGFHVPYIWYEKEGQEIKLTISQFMSLMDCGTISITKREVLLRDRRLAVQKLRSICGLPLMECLDVLKLCEWNMDDAIKVLFKGLTKR